MSFLSAEFYLFLAAAVLLYYLVPLRFRWVTLWAADFAYFYLATRSKRGLVLFICVIVMSYVMGLLLETLSLPDPVGAANAADPDTKAGTRTGDDVSGRSASGPIGDAIPTTGTDTSGSSVGGAAPGVVWRLWVRRLVLAVGVVSLISLLAICRSATLIDRTESLLGWRHYGVLIPIGTSFFTMQLIAYLADVYRGTIRAQRNVLKFMLFASFFPQLLQGPIPRYEQLEPQLIQGHRFEERNLEEGLMRILWGFFLKLMIADKAGIVVDTIFASPGFYGGLYVLVGGILYSIQLYADFMACVSLAQGAADMFGIHLADNFRRPYLSTSVKEFWNRWHISLSSWLRDYVYIPLGGNRKGTFRRYWNLILTFTVSGLWHGGGLKYVVWGLMHAGYQIIGERTARLRDRIFVILQISDKSHKRRWIRRFSTFMAVTIAWVLFRAQTLSDGLLMLRSMVTVWNPWIFTDDSLLGLGLGWKEWMILLLCILLLICIGVSQEKEDLKGRILAQPLYLRYLLYGLTVFVIVLFGTYGAGYNAADFIYGGF